jgi:carboxyl-terminal processing protease
MKSKKRLSLLLLLLLFVHPIWAEVTEVSLEGLVPSRAHRQAAMIITRVVERYHYRSMPLDDRLSEEILTRYLESLDPNRSFFTREDIDRFAVYNHQLDDALKSAGLDPAFNIFHTYRARVDAVIAYALSLLDKEFDFSRDETYRFDRSEAAWVEDKAALDELWRMRVKNDVLSLRLAGKETADIRDTLRDRYEGMARRTRQLDGDDVFQIFVNAYTLSLEPHTSYMSPRVSENFDISMRLSLEGIGAVLRNHNEYTVVQRTVPGGPASLSGKVKSGDRIVGIAQGEKGDVVDVVGWRLQDVVDLIRGPKDSVVRLVLLSKDGGADGPARNVTLVRNKIKLEDQAASSYVVDDLDGLGKRRIGVVTIPSFYRDFRSYSEGDKDFRSTTRDVRRLLQELEKERVDGVVIDLRQNGGGSLSEATELTGLFIDTGPVVQVKDTSGKLDIERDSDPGVAYTGPLAVLVDRNSASASEIFAGAIQDYHRGIIIGEPTFGKGTVQTLLDLDRFVTAGSEQLGRLRLTMAQFFRVNGGSTQFRGVVPDIVFPTAANSLDHGERSLDNALPWASIAAAEYKADRAAAVGHLQELHAHRIASDPGFKMLADEEVLLRELRDQHTVSLMEKRRKLEWDERDNKLRDVRNRFRASQGLEPLAKVSEHDLEPEIEDEAKAEDDIVKRIMVNEAARILVDYLGGLQPQSTIAHVGQAEVQPALAQP